MLVHMQTEWQEGQEESGRMTEVKLNLSNVMCRLNRKRLTAHITTNVMYLVLK